MDLFNQKPLFEKKYGSKSLGKSNLTFAEINANIGEMRLAFEEDNCQSAWAIEHDRFAQLTYQTNFKNKTIESSSSDKLPKVDILTATLLPKLSAFSAFANILKVQENAAFLITTTTNVTTNKKLWQAVQDELTNCNFDVYFSILDAAKFGVPQYRKQLFIVGFRCDYFQSKPKFTFPKGDSKKVYIKDILEESVSGYSVSEHFQEFHLFRTSNAQVVDNQSKTIAKSLTSSYHKIQPLVGTFVKDAETGIRLLSENECKALMGFHRDFMFPISRTQMYRQLGKASVIPVLKAIAFKIKIQLCK